MSMNTTDESNHAAVVEALNRELLAALTALKHSSIACWCPYGLGDRMYRQHSEACTRAQAAYVKAGGQ